MVAEALAQPNAVARLRSAGGDLTTAHRIQGRICFWRGCDPSPLPPPRLGERGSELPEVSSEPKHSMLGIQFDPNPLTAYWDG